MTKYFDVFSLVFRKLEILSSITLRKDLFIHKEERQRLIFINVSPGVSSAGKISQLYHLKECKMWNNCPNAALKERWGILCVDPFIVFTLTKKEGILLSHPSVLVIFSDLLHPVSAPSLSFQVHHLPYKTINEEIHDFSDRIYILILFYFSRFCEFYTFRYQVYFV